MKWKSRALVFFLICSLCSSVFISTLVTAAFTFDSTDWAYYRILTVDADYVDTDLTDFPVLVVISSAIGAKCDGGDSIRFTDYDDFVIPYEIESWNATGNSYVWVKLDLENSANTNFYMYYNNTAASDGQDVNAVWDSDYSVVYHMANASIGLNDSTAGINNSIATGGNPTYHQTGKIGYGVDFDGTDDNFSLDNSVEDEGNVTIEVW